MGMLPVKVSHGLRSLAELERLKAATEETAGTAGAAVGSSRSTFSMKPMVVSSSSASMRCCSSACASRHSSSSRWSMLKFLKRHAQLHSIASFMKATKRDASHGRSGRTLA